METKLIYKKMSQVMSEIGAITKNQNNSVQNFKFRGIDQFVNSLYPALTKHGVFMTPRCKRFSQDIKDVVRSSGKAGVDKHVAIEMEYEFYAEDGSSVVVGPVPAEGLDSGDKATNKALSAALKYALIQTFSIPTEDMAEADSDSPEIGKPSFWDKKDATTAAKVETIESPRTVAAQQTTSTDVAKAAAGFTKPKFNPPSKTKLNGTAPTVTKSGGFD